MEISAAVRISALFLVAAQPLNASSDVTTNSLLKEMVDLQRLTRRPAPFFKTSQASSYDRASVSPGQEGWFANADWGKYVRTEQKEGRKEYVMADLVGPGAVVRIWSANPAGTIRFYFDGEESPRIEAKTGDLLRGSYELMGAPFGYSALRGTDLYFPLPYSQSLKVTVDDTEEDAASKMYYQIGYRTYEPGTEVTTFNLRRVLVDELDAVADVLQDPDNREFPRGTEDSSFDYRIAAGSSWSTTIGRASGGAFSEFVLTPDMPAVPTAVKRWSDPRHAHNLLRGMVLRIAFDGQETVRAPVSDFFGSPPFGTPYRSFAFTIREDGAMVCRFWMPFQSNATVTLENNGFVPVRGDLDLKVSPYDWDDRSLYFHTQWVADRGNTRPMRDFSFLDVVGEGHYVGSTLYVGNHSPAWWGEGDEKIWIDNEPFPSTFGTGTEDYYGYAWSDPRPYDNVPYHTQPSAGKPANFGHISNNRWHVIDPITFTTRLKFDMEIWHWQETMATFAATTYWYATGSATGPLPLDAELMDVIELKPPPPVPGAIEGEKMLVVQKTAGDTQIQTGFFGLSGESQLWWIDAFPGDELILEFDVPEDGEYDVLGSFCHARDYGIHEFTISGQSGGQHDFFLRGVEWKRVELGRFSLKKGKARMIVKVVGTHPDAVPKRHMMGLDYVLLNKVG